MDIFQVRGWDGSFTHVNSHNLVKENPYNLQFAEAFKKRGIKAVVSPVWGFRDPDLIESYVFEINALQARYSYLLRRVKEMDGAPLRR